MEIEAPVSPITGSTISVEDCFQELIKFTLYLLSNHKLQTGLSAHYCAQLLQGVSSYKRLAYAIYHSTIHNNNTSVNQLSIDTKNWDELIVNKGRDVLEMLKDVNFELHVQEPFFSQLYEGVKTVEGRCAVGDYNIIKPGDVLLFNKCMTLQVQDVHLYASFREMLEVESLARVLPGVTTVEQGVQVYRKFYSEEKENSNGVIGICVEPPTCQLYSVMASLLSGLSYGGIQYLLGKNQDLPPPAL